MDEQRLPFPIHGTRLSGDGDPARGMGEAARLLYFVNLIAETANVPVFQLSRQTPYGHVTASVHGPLAFKSVRADEEPEEAQEEPVQGVHRLVWLPEGFVITPRTAGAPEGFGMPPTQDGKGTPGGPLRQVIINKFKDNQYPDAVYRWAVALNSAAANATDAEIADAAGKVPAGTVFAANLFFMGWELDDPEFGIGIMDGDGDDAELLPQFSQRWAPNYRELESGRWHCHRPQTAINESSNDTLMRQETNLVREEVGKPALGPPLRGMEGELSQNVAYQMRWSGIQAHNSTKFREGHRLFDERAFSRAGYASSLGENLFGGTPASQDAWFVHKAIDGWRNSPGHYANMISPWADGAGGEVLYASLDTAITDSGKLFQTPGAAAVQIFSGAEDWVAAGSGTHGERAPVTVVGEQCMFTPIYPGLHGESTGYWPKAAYRGRTIYLTDSAVSSYAMSVLSGTTVVEDGAETKLRVAMLEVPGRVAGKAYLVVYEGAANDFVATRKEVVRYQLPQVDADQISTPVWSKSGKKVAFCFTTLSPVPPGRINRGVSEAAPTTFVGQQLHFVEINGDALILRGTDRLQIDPTDFSPNHRNSFCKSSVRLLPVYKGEDLNYINVEVDSYVRFSPERFEKRVHGALVFPDGTRVVYADQSGSDWDVPGAARHFEPVRGFVRHILPFDVSDPDSVAYIQYDHPEKLTDPGISARLVIRGTQVMHSPMAYDSGFAGPHYRNNWGFDSAEYTLDSFRGDPYTDPTFGKGFSFFGHITDKYTPSVVFDGVVVGNSYFYPPLVLAIGPPNSYVGPVATSPYDTSFVLVGPTFLRDGALVYGGVYDDRYDEVFERVEQFRYARYGDEWLYAGRIENTLGGSGEFTSEWAASSGANKTHFVRSAWLGDDQYYFHSSLDLKAITGLPDLKDNILPIGVL